MDFHEKLKEDVANYVKELLEINHIQAIDGELVNIIFNRYALMVVATYIRKVLYMFCMFCAAIAVVVMDTPLPIWVRLIFAYTMVRYIRVGTYMISEEAIDHFTQKVTPDIFNNHKDLWKLDESRKDDK